MKYINYAAWLPSPAAPLEVATAPLPTPEDLADDEIIIKTHAVAINPVDWKIRDSPPDQNRFGIKYPFVLGEDVAGEVLHVGKAVAAATGPRAFRAGDRVMGYAMALGPGRGAPYGGFQLYVRLRAAAVARIPEGLSFEKAVVLPLSVSTAAAGLYMSSTLGLKLPGASGSGSGSVVARRAEKGKDTLLLWGGSSSVGSSVVQLAVASGYSVVATASPANYAYVRSLGADYVLDYHNPDVVGILSLLLRGSGARVVGAYDAIGSESTVRQAAAVLAGVGGGRVASVGWVPSSEDGGLGSDGSGDKVEAVRVGATGIVDAEPEVASRIWGDYVPAAMEDGTLRPAPRETVVGKGLYYVQGALDLNKRGVSASKVVVQL